MSQSKRKFEIRIDMLRQEKGNNWEYNRLVTKWSNWRLSAMTMLVSIRNPTRERVCAIHSFIHLFNRSFVLSFITPVLYYITITTNGINASYGCYHQSICMLSTQFTHTRKYQAYTHTHTHTACLTYIVDIIRCQPVAMMMAKFSSNNDDRTSWTLR